MAGAVAFSVLSLNIYLSSLHFCPFMFIYGRFSFQDQSCGDEKLAGTSSRASDPQQDERPQDNAPADIIVSSGAVAELTCPEFVCSIPGINNGN